MRMPNAKQRRIRSQHGHIVRANRGGMHEDGHRCTGEAIHGLEESIGLVNCCSWGRSSAAAAVERVLERQEVKDV